MSEILDIFCGWDAREAVAFEVCRRSLERHASKPVHIVPLMERSLRFNGWYTRTWHVEGEQKIDDTDKKPFSTEFSFSRFLVPAMMQHRGWALYADCDFVFTADIAALFDHADPQFAVQVVQHRHVPEEATKMEGQVQSPYFRKNWSSLVLWNCEHPSNKLLTTQAVNAMPGQWLHAFSWLRDDEIGTLPGIWNYLVDVDHYAPPKALPNGLHYTLGTPNMRKGAAFQDVWWKEHEMWRPKRAGELMAKAMVNA